MTREEAIAAIACVTPLTPADLDGFLSCTDEERQALIVAYRDAGVMPSASAWDEVLSILKTSAELAGLVLPIAGAIGAVFNLTKLGS